MLTKDDLGQIKTIVNDVVEDKITRAVAPLATKSELNETVQNAVAPLATKVDLAGTERRLQAAILGMDLAGRDSFARLDDHEARLTKLERARPA